MAGTIVNPKETNRAEAFELWMQAPQPMVTMFTTSAKTTAENLLPVPPYPDGRSSRYSLPAFAARDYKRGVKMSGIWYIYDVIYLRVGIK